MHLVLRNRPDLAGNMTDEDVALRWWNLFPKRRNPYGEPEEPTPEELDLILVHKAGIHELRSRLSSISWLMRCLKEPVARRANEEDRCSGRFWEGRFKSIALLDQAAILACSIYVDLNPIRAGIATTPETSAFTSARERVEARQAQKALISKGLKERNCLEELKQKVRKDRWLCPLKSEARRRGFLNIALDDYLELLDWTGRQVVTGKKGSVPSDLVPILTRLEVNQAYWIQASTAFGSSFHRAAGTVSNMERVSREIGQRWLQGKKTGARLFRQAG